MIHPRAFSWAQSPGYASLAECVADLEANGQLRRIDIEVDPCLEMGMIQRRAFQAKAPALLFMKPKGCAFPMLANLFGTRERVKFIFRHSMANLEYLLAAAREPRQILRSPFKMLRILPKLLKTRPLKNRATALHADNKAPVTAKQCLLSELPRLISWPGDGGPFITLPLVYSEDPDKPGAANLGMYRVQLAGNEYLDNEVGMHYMLKRGIANHHASALARQIDLPVHVHVGGPPALTMAAVMPLPEGMNELAFAGILGNRRVSLSKIPGFDIPVLSDCDFLLKGTIGTSIKPEGPFGDHLGYYSMRHNFPVMKVERVYHRPDAIWPFTTVGRPPQEDTVLGDFIHSLTGPVVGQVFEGIREVHAVDASGVHPLLLAIGEERYTAYEAARKPRELLTQGMHLLGTTQTALAKYLLLAAASDAPGLNTRDVSHFLRHMLERTDFTRDLHFITRTTCDTLDYSGGNLNEGSKLIWVAAGEKKRELATEISDFPDLPGAFERPVLIAPGIIAIKGPAHHLKSGHPDPDLEKNLCPSLERWRDREHFPLIIIVDDPEFCASSTANFLWVTFTRSDPATDCYGAFARTTAKHWACAEPLIIDARKKDFHAPELEENPEIARRVEKLAVKGGPLAGLF